MLASSLLVTAHMLVWHTYTGAEQRALEQAAASYSRRHPEVTVEPIAIPYGSFADKLQAAIPRGHGPDAFIYAHDLVGQWAAERLIQPLSAQPAVAACVPALWPKTVEPLLLRAPNASPDARPILYGVPLAFKSLALFYRTDLLRTPPSDTAALFAMAADRSRSPETTTPPYPLAYESGSFFYHAVWLHGLGGAVISPQSGRPTLDTPAQAAALRFVQRLQAQQVIPEDMSASLVARFFNEGHAASVISGPWFVGDIAAGVPYSVAPLPRVSETGLFAAPFTTVEAGFVSATAQKPSEAAAFLADLATGEAALLRLRTGRQAVTERAAWQDKAAIDDPILQAFFVQLPSLTPTPSHPGMRAFWEPGQQALRQALRGNEPVAALQAGQHLLDVYLAPALPAAAPMPYLLVVGLLLLGGAALLVARSRRMALWPQIVRNRSAYGYLAPSVLVLAMLGLFPAWL